MNLSSFCTKAIGAVTAGLVLYDAHKTGCIISDSYAKNNIANTMADQYVQSNMITKASTVEANTKKAWFRFIIDNNLSEAIDSAVGYAKGACSSFVSDVVPAALATGSILFGGKRSGRLCGLGLLLYGAKYMLYDVMTVGKKNYLKS